MVTIEPSARRLRLEDRELDLTTTEYEILARLVLAAGHVVSRDELMLSVFGRALDPCDRSLDVHISHVRQKLGSHRSLILTIRGRRLHVPTRARRRMTCSILLGSVPTLFLALCFGQPLDDGASVSTLSGAWVLNKELSTPTTTFAGPAAEGRRTRRPPADGAGGGWGGRIGSMSRGGAREPIRREDDEEKQRAQRAAIAELLQPSPRLTITHTSVDVTFVDADGHARKYKTSGERQKNQLFSSTVETKTRWKDGTLKQEFSLAAGAKVTLEHTVDPSSDQLIVVATPGDPPRGPVASARWVYDRVR